uniref:Uncharacterized protein n=1 Tax=Picea glauca TaxID=3330 RepID=A0A117NHK8_PICGL|nr:hypothetical protein ABT39_MTgene4562 [Picea glauca]
MKESYQGKLACEKQYQQERKEDRKFDKGKRTEARASKEGSKESLIRHIFRLVQFLYAIKKARTESEYFGRQDIREGSTGIL